MEWVEHPDSDLADRIEGICMAWEWTPYRESSQVRGAGVDCVRFVAAVADELSGQRTNIRALPADRAFHDPAGARAGMHRLMRQFNARRVRDNTIQAGDVLVTAPVGGGPGHAMIAGGRKFIYHATRGEGVVRTGLGLEGMELVAVLRVRNQDTIWSAQ